MKIAEHLVKIKSIVKELELLMAVANPMDKNHLFEPAVRLEVEVCDLVNEADRLGNL